MQDSPSLFVLPARAARWSLVGRRKSTLAFGPSLYGAATKRKGGIHVAARPGWLAEFRKSIWRTPLPS
jgi:hypothetical protein